MGKVAVVLLNSGSDTADLSFNFKDIPGVTATSFTVRDLWAHKDMGSATGSFTAKAIASHDCAFLVLTPSTAEQ
jgi:alpha-galactosidase